MSIRLKNIDFNTSGADLFAQRTAFLGDITAAAERVCFIAPVDCVLDTVDVYARNSMPGAAATASVTIVTLSVRLASATGTVLSGPRGTSANGVSNSDEFCANHRYRLTCTANNSLSVGTQIVLLVSAQNSGNLSAVYTVASFTPRIHMNR